MLSLLLRGRGQFIFDRHLLVERVQLFALCCLIFFIPISSAAFYVFGVLLIFLWIIQGRYYESWLVLKSNPIFWAFSAYAILFPLSILWSDNLEWAIDMGLSNFKRYLFFPFILLAIQKKYIPLYLSVFIAGVTFTELVSYLVWFELITIEGVLSSNPTPFYSHVYYNPMLAWGFYLLAITLLFQKMPVWLRLVILGFVITMSINMFITGGRGGQLTFLALLFALLMLYFYKRKQLILGFVLSIMIPFAVVYLAYHNSPLFHERVNLAIDEAGLFSPDTRTSVGLRLAFWENTFYLAFNRPWQEVMFGAGVGDFQEDYNSVLRHDNAMELTPYKSGFIHPHNQYLYQLGTFGIFGLFIFLSMYFVMGYMACKKRDRYTVYRVGFIIFMIMIFITDALFLSKPLTALILVFMAMFFSNKFLGTRKTKRRNPSD